MKTQPSFADIINLNQYELQRKSFRDECRQTLDKNGVLVLPNFLQPAALASIQKEGEINQAKAFYTTNEHNIYISAPDPAFSSGHPRNQKISSSKGCITADQIPAHSALQRLYHASEFRSFLCATLAEETLYEYVDSLSSLNIHYASRGQELGWHFDNSSFAITLMIQGAEKGGMFEYVKNVRNADSGEMNYALCGEILEGRAQTTTLTITPGTLVLFRGRNSLHRVTPVEGGDTRMLAGLAYNTEPGVSLSESARMTFFGRLN